jgi:hypothetical protein
MQRCGERMSLRFVAARSGSWGARRNLSDLGGCLLAARPMTGGPDNIAQEIAHVAGGQPPLV